MSKGLQRIFLDWNRPLLEQAAELLMADAGDGMLLDLSDTLAIVPTRNAARRLREMLANLADERATAVIPPLCGPPTLLVRPEDGAALLERPLAGTAEVLATWISVLRNFEARSYPHLFPIEPALRDFAWAQGMARDLIEVRSILGEAGLLMVDVARRLPTDHEENDRWQDLGKIEAEYQELLRKLGRCDPVVARRAAAERAGLSPETKKIVMVGTSDPFPLAQIFLERMAKTIPVIVAVYAPESMAEAFDEWGQPLADFWSGDLAPIEIDDFSSTVRVLANPDQQDEVVVATVEACPAREETLAIGVLDSAQASLMERALRDRDIPGFAPEGRALRSEGIVYFLEALRDFASRAKPAAAAVLLRTPEIDAWLEVKIKGWRQADGLRAIDDGCAGHLVDDCERLAAFLRSDADYAESRELPGEREAVRCRMAAAALDELLTLRRRLSVNELKDSLPEVLREVLICRKSTSNKAEELWPEKVIETAGPILLNHLAELSAADAAKVGINLNRAEQLTLAISLLAKTRLSAERPAAALELQGWLELLWEDAPHLVVAGLNDGVVPEAVVGHPFLPQSLRSLDVLGLKGNAERFARDAYQLTALLQSRRDGGRVDLLLVRRSSAGDPMRPSRLLLRCADEQLPARVGHLFREIESGGTSASWDAGFRLLPNAPSGGDADQAAPIEKLSVTAFRAYLESPFHFYMEKVLRAKTVEPALGELDAMEFGNFCHHVLEVFGLDEQARDLEDAGAIEKYFMDEAERYARRVYGASPPLAVRVQLRAAQQRLQAAARVQALERQAGWIIVDAELDLKDKPPLVFGGVRVSGRIDRIEQRDGVTRVLDYKTSDKAKKPQEAHFVGIVTGVDYSDLRDYARFDMGTEDKPKPKRWKDLQLPLYCLALESAYGSNIEAGYFALPKSLGETGVMTLDLDDGMLDAARRCAEGIIADVQAGRFWPLEPKGDWDNYDGLHLGMADKTIDAQFIEGGQSA